MSQSHSPEIPSELLGEVKHWGARPSSRCGCVSVCVYLCVSVCVCVKLYIHKIYHLTFPGGPSGKESACQCRLDITDVSSVSGLGRSPGDGNGNPLQYSCLENSMDRGTWWAAVCGVTQSWTWLKQLSTHTHNLSNQNAELMIKY